MAKPLPKFQRYGLALAVVSTIASVLGLAYVVSTGERDRRDKAARETEANPPPQAPVVT